MLAKPTTFLDHKATMGYGDGEKMGGKDINILGRGGEWKKRDHQGLRRLHHTQLSLSRDYLLFIIY